jgi:hypothetical protein
MFPTLFSRATCLNAEALEVAPGEDAIGELDWEKLEKLSDRMIASPAASFCNLCACAFDKLSGERL